MLVVYGRFGPVESLIGLIGRYLAVDFSSVIPILKLVAS
uniref:Uncharacterized protein n=1 Tax=Arundo donax TaxID=35708 RepID=A0A0A8YE89_ARUDO